MISGSPLALALSQSGTSQMELSRLTGVSQGRISEYAAGKVAMSQAMLSHLLSAMGYAAELTVFPVPMNSSDQRSWRLHRAVARKLTRGGLSQIKTQLISNLRAQRTSVRGEPHLSRLADWERMILGEDIKAIRRCCLDVGERGRQFRDVSPLGGILTEAERTEALNPAAREATR
ncbi:MAG: helix-turn-helix transcriptional regulator [Bifidobacteriaceae bacterium]|jgi:transcriptional regulator with XRE-family HTH domain|nr:helix-turn-helix transcriptional regulator [Bifidobacteriaceae bacterium]